MCELLALSFDSPVQPAPWLAAWFPRAANHPHGWGVAFTADDAILIEKEAVYALESPRAAAMARDQTRSTQLFIAHIRDASCGKVALENTHPFRTTFGAGELVLAHNGTLERAALLAEFHTPPAPQGETDSELALLWIRQELESASSGLNAFATLHTVLQRLNKFGLLNLMLTDGNLLLVYRDEQSRKDLHYRNVTEGSAPSGFVIATAPVDQADWSKVPPGALLAFRLGQLVFCE